MVEPAAPLIEGGFAVRYSVGYQNAFLSRIESGQLEEITVASNCFSTQ